MRAHGLIFLAIVTFGASPMLAVGLAGVVARANGCQLDGTPVYPCEVLGWDAGPTLSAMGFAGWFTFLTVPIALVALVLHAILVLVLAHGDARRSNKGSQGRGARRELP